MVALWKSKDFLHFKIYSIAEVVALTQEDGDIEHTKEILENDTKLWKKLGLCYATGKILQRGRKNKDAVECAVEKDSRTEKPQIADAARMHKDAKLHESSWHNQEMVMIYANTVVTFIRWV